MTKMLLGLAVAAALIVPTLGHCAEPGWPAYGGDAGGQRFSPAAPDHARQRATLPIAWSYSTGDCQPRRRKRDFAFENTPILAGGGSTSARRSTRSRARSGDGRGSSGASIRRSTAASSIPNSYTCRGVAYWRDPAAPPARPAPRASS